MKIFTKKKIKELQKAGEIQAIVDLWEREKELNPVYCTKDELDRLTYCQKETLKESIKKGLKLGLSDDDIGLIREVFCICRPEYGMNSKKSMEYPF